MWDEDKRSWHGGGDDLWRAKNPPDAILAYYLKTAATDVVKIQAVDANGKIVREFDGPRTAGIHRVLWDLKSTGGERIAPGSYTFRLAANGRISVASIDVTADPNRK